VEARVVVGARTHGARFPFRDGCFGAVRAQKRELTVDFLPLGYQNADGLLAKFFCLD
jgi:hypothetical protein